MNSTRSLDWSYPISDLHIWKRGDVAWFSMELDYIRYIDTEVEKRRMVTPLRETGVLEREKDRWILVAWHESTARLTALQRWNRALLRNNPLHRTADQPLNRPLR